MRPSSEVVEIATQGLRARPLRAVLMSLGPLLGVAVIVGAVGVLTSTKGELRAALDRLGSNVITVESGEGLGTAVLPAEAGERVRSMPNVEGVAALGSVEGVTVEAAGDDGDLLDPIATRVLTAGPDLVDVLQLSKPFGRVIGPADESAVTRAAVIGGGVAEQIAFGAGAVPVIYVGDYPFAVVGVVETTALAPELHTAVLIPSTTAEVLFGTDPRPAKLIVRVSDGYAGRIAPLLATVVTFGGPGSPTVRIPSDLLAAQAEVDQTLTAAVLALGLLAMLVGSFGIANVMLISVMERRREIGVRRALGHRRTVIGAQFVVEAALVGVAGGVVGAALGIGFTALLSALRGWVLVVDVTLAAAAAGASVVITTAAGVYPAIRAARVEPLEALRAD